MKTGIEGVGLQQLHVFDAPQRDDRGWVLSVAYLAVAPWAAIRAPALVVPVAERGALAFDHDQIVERALSTIRQNYREHPDPYRLIAEPFTIRELHDLHQHVAGKMLMRDSFCRAMSPFLQETGDLATGTVGKPARASSIDEFRRSRSYLTGLLRLRRAPQRGLRSGRPRRASASTSVSDSTQSNEPWITVKRVTHRPFSCAQSHRGSMDRTCWFPGRFISVPPSVVTQRFRTLPTTTICHTSCIFDE